ncbi:nuclear pore complex subunit Nro1-domain-containing protein [Chytridium lagenaria]|nr:nuclear pore complex subunit Nro1-domain-containing protein [Chytridium lagenaria]
MPMKKRPGGLKQAAAAAASAPSSSEENPKKKIKLSTDPNETIAVPITDDVISEFAELKELFESALSKLGEGDADEGSMLLRGVIHECDRILRTRAAAEEAGETADTKLGLLSIGDDSDDEEMEKSDDESPMAFLDAAVERFEIGLEDKKDDWSLHQALGRVLIEKANIMVRNKAVSKPEKGKKGKKDDGAKDLKNTVDKAIKHFTTCISHVPETQFEEESINVSEANPKSYPALKCKGASYLGRANVILLGETLVNKGNLCDEREEKDLADEAYREAVKCFKKVEAVDPSALPDQFESFIKSWEADLQDS